MFSLTCFLQNLSIFPVEIGWNVFSIVLEFYWITLLGLDIWFQFLDTNDNPPFPPLFFPGFLQPLPTTICPPLPKVIHPALRQFNLYWIFKFGNVSGPMAKLTDKYNYGRIYKINNAFISKRILCNYTLYHISTFTDNMGYSIYASKSQTYLICSWKRKEGQESVWTSGCNLATPFKKHIQP